MTETPFGQTAVMLIRSALRCSASYKGIEKIDSSVVLVDSPFVLPIKMVISGLEIGMSERSEFFRFPGDNHFYRGAAGQHMGCPGVVRGMGTHSPDSTLSRNKI
jgi:hypothetical protein